MKNKVILAGTMMALAFSQQVAVPEYAEARSNRRVYYATPVRRASVFDRHPIISRAVTGGALGAIGGAVVGAISGRRRVGKGALIGAGTGAALGAGLGLYRNRQRTGYWF